MVLVQVALDLTNLKQAFKIAEKVKENVDIIEVGTPLIFSKGLSIIKKFKTFGKPICADVKIIDAGEKEAKIAIDSGADIITICAWAVDETIQNAIKVAKKYNVETEIFTFGRKIPLPILEKICKLKPEYVVKQSPSDILSSQPDIKKREINLLRRNKIKLGISGGLTPEKIRKVEKYKKFIDLVVVGRYITAGENPKKAIEEIKNLFE